MGKVKITREEFVKRAKQLDIQGSKEAWDIYYEEKIEQVFTEMGKLFMYLQALKYEQSLYEKISKLLKAKGVD